MLAVALRLIEQHRRSRSHLLVAIDGGGGAGKSTLARNLADALGDATIVQMDDFYRPMPAAERAALTPGEGVDRYFDWSARAGQRASAAAPRGHGPLSPLRLGDRRDRRGRGGGD